MYNRIHNEEFTADKYFLAIAIVAKNVVRRLRPRKSVENSL